MVIYEGTMALQITDDFAFIISFNSQNDFIITIVPDLHEKTEMRESEKKNYSRSQLIKGQDSNLCDCVTLSLCP